MQDGTIDVPENLEAGDPAEHPGVVNKFGINETLDIVDSLVKLANAVKVTLEDKKFSPMEVFNFTGALISLPKALAGLDTVPAEVGDLDNDEIIKLVDRVTDTLEYVEDFEAKNIINKALVAALAIKDLVDEIKSVH